MNIKPNIFIGSSVEGLKIAQAIQENLEYDANVSIWTQGIFKLSSNVLTDLLNSLGSFDFAIFVFNADDIVIIKGDKYSAARDNVIFELGLFMGKLGKDRVFYLIPSDIENLRLPSDLIGVTPGTYNNDRRDANLVAAVGTFCNQVRQAITSFKHEKLEEFKNESYEARRLIIEKPRAWEFILFAELLDKKFSTLQENYNDFQNELIFIKTKGYSGIEFFKWFGENLIDMEKLINLMNNLFHKPMEDAFGPHGQPGDPVKIKRLAEIFYSFSNELLKWEMRLAEIDPPKELHSIKQNMQGWAKDLFEQINEVPSEMRRILSEILSNAENIRKIKFRLEIPNSMSEAVSTFKVYFEQTGIWPES